MLEKIPKVTGVNFLPFKRYLSKTTQEGGKRRPSLIGEIVPSMD